MSTTRKLAVRCESYLREPAKGSARISGCGWCCGLGGERALHSLSVSLSLSASLGLSLSLSISLHVGIYRPTPGDGRASTSPESFRAARTRWIRASPFVARRYIRLRRREEGGGRSSLSLVVLLAERRSALLALTRGPRGQSPPKGRPDRG